MVLALEIFGIITVLLVVTLGGIAVIAFTLRKPLVDGFEMGGLRVVKDGFVSFCVLQIEERDVAFIDTGYDRSGKAILDEISRRGLGAGDVKAIMLTHGHGDHTASVHSLPKCRGDGSWDRGRPCGGTHGRLRSADAFFPHKTHRHQGDADS